MEIMPAAAETLGVSRTGPLSALARRIGELQELTGDAGTTELLLVPLRGAAARRWEQLARQRREDWVFVKSADGARVLAADEPSEAGMRDHAAAVIYPELHTRLVSWWLVHAWRGIDLVEDTLHSLYSWRITSSAVTARALIEEAGCLLYEGVKLADAWRTGKAASEGPLMQPSAVRDAMAPVLNKAAFGSRMKESHERAQAISVVTYVQKLAKATGDKRFSDWYDWLSDAAHPAFGARIALACPPMKHDSGATVVRTYARAPMVLQQGNGHRIQMDFTIAFAVADALIASGAVICDLLEQALLLVDDFGLTTGAATLTRRWYWRDFKPVRGNRACPCGRGSWSDCRHRWGEPAPRVVVPQTAGAAT